MSLPIDFASMDLVRERQIHLLGRITTRSAIWLPAIFLAFITAHAVLGFLSWPEPDSLAHNQADIIAEDLP